MERIVIGTRGSALALTQANLVKAELTSINPGLSVDIQIIKTEGDRKQGTPLAAQSDKKEWIIDLERALLANEIDLAVHSGKDVPLHIEKGTEIRSVLQRASPFDAFIGKRLASGTRLRFADLPQGAIVGTASLRRRASLLAHRADLSVREHRGNVPTRLQKLDDSPELAGIILAAAGLERLALPNVTYEIIDRAVILPSMNQGALAIQLRQDDARVSNLAASIIHTETTAEFVAERAVSEVLGGDCHSAISIFAEVSGDFISVSTRVFAKDAKSSISHSGSGPVQEAAAIGERVGREVLKLGAAALLA